MSVDNVDARLAWRLAPEVVFTPSSLDFGQVDRGFKKVRAVYVSNFSGPIDRSAVSCSEGTPWFRIDLLTSRPWPDHNRLSFSTYESQGLTLHLSGAQVGYQQNLGVVGWSPAWSLDGTQLAYFSESDGAPQLYMMNATGEAPIRLTASTAPKSAVAWSPDGRKVAFLAGQPEQGILNIIDSHAWSRSNGVPSFVGNDKLSRTVNTIFRTQGQPNKVAGYTRRFAWSPNSKALLFDYYQEQQTRIFQVDVNGDIVAVAADSWSPTWSPDGTAIAAVAAGGLFRKAISGQERFYLTRRQANAPAWSPDGQRIAFLADNETADRDIDPSEDPTGHHTRDLWIIDTTGDNETFLAEDCVTFAWSPVGQQLAYVTGDGQSKPPIYYLWTMALATQPTLLAEINDPSIAWKPTP